LSHGVTVGAVRWYKAARGHSYGHTLSMSNDRFRKKLREQLTFIETSCTVYDAGNRSEAVRIGTSLRVLLHDTSTSTSLLTHLGAKQVQMLSTCPVNVTGPSGHPPMAFDGLAAFSARGILPKLGMSSTKIELSANEWWEQVVFIAGDGVTRKIIALAAANKDGGAHVDSDLPQEYERLVEGVWARFGGGQIADHHLLYLRQMGYEVLNSPKLIALAA
jgi:hypothetical protein